jgi:hypothetical protein
MQRSLAVLASFAIAAAVVAQPPGGGGRRGGGRGFTASQMAVVKDVQADIKITDEQKEKLSAFEAKQTEARAAIRNLPQEERGPKMQEMAKEAETALAEILKPEQVKRLKQIVLQVSGMGAFASPAVETGLSITDEQKEKIKTIAGEVRTENTSIMQGDGTPEEKQKKVAENNKGGLAKVKELLTAEQKTKWGELVGAPYTGALPQIARGGGKGKKQP